MNLERNMAEVVEILGSCMKSPQKILKNKINFSSLYKHMNLKFVNNLNVKHAIGIKAKCR